MKNTDSQSQDDGSRPIRDPEDLLGEALSRLNTHQIDSLMSKAADEALRLRSKQQEQDIEQAIDDNQIESVTSAASRLSQKETSFDIRSENISQHGSVFINICSKREPLINCSSIEPLSRKLRNTNISKRLLFLTFLVTTSLISTLLIVTLNDEHTDGISTTSDQPRLRTEGIQSQTIAISRVIDGDTLVISHVPGGSNEETVRLLAIDTPERNQSGYSEATSALIAATQSGTMTLAYETPNVMERDRYGRVLAYILVDGKNINIEMVRMGWSKYITQYGSSRFASDFIAAENEAMRDKSGIWSTP